MSAISLTNRAIIEIAGRDAEHFLDNLVTCQVAGLMSGEARFGALLTPQGKIMFDFFVIRTADAYLIDTHALLVEELVKRLTFYRLRAKVEITPRPELEVSAHWNCEKPAGELVIADPRHRDMGYRAYDSRSLDEDAQAYRALRISNAIAEGGIDFEYGDAYPHEVLMDQFGGVDFKKGCYVGQEVVSRMQHRGATKKRVLKIAGETGKLIKDAEITADNKPAGKIGSVSGNRGLAILRLDRVATAKEVSAGDVLITPSLPDWVNFTWPEAR